PLASCLFHFFFQAEDGIRDFHVTGVQTCALPILFGEADVYITSRLAFKLGTRFEHSSIIDQTNLAPRASIAYKLGKGTQASLAYGIFYQNPERRYLPASSPLDFMKATHYIAQFQRVVSQQSFRAEI